MTSKKQLTSSISYSTHKNNFGNVIMFFDENAKHIGSLIAEENVDDLDELKDELLYSVGFTKEQTAETLNTVNDLINSILEK